MFENIMSAERHSVLEELVKLPLLLDKEQVSLTEMLKLYPQKYPVKTYQPLVLLKAFGYFADAEGEAMRKNFISYYFFRHFS